MSKIINTQALFVVFLTFVGQAIAGCPLLDKELKYEFHGTKTIYTDAYNYLNSKDDLSGSFDDDTLEEEHKDLVKDGCKPVVFYFVGRHSARFPDAEDIEEHNKNLKNLQAKLRFIESSLQCPKRYKGFFDWQPKMTPQHDNLITDLGGDEQRDIAKRFKKIYPEFFDSSKADLKIGVTGKIRTAQTAVEFLQEVKGWEIDESCRRNVIPSNDLEEPGYNLNKIINNGCYKKLMSQNLMPELSFHDQCEALVGKKPKNSIVEKIKDPKVLKAITDKIAEQLQLPAGSITDKVFDSIYSTCKFENALKNDSIWCTLFEKSDIKSFEYIEDVKSYINDAYGPNANVQQACPLVSDLINSFKNGMELSGKDGEKRKAHFYFSHAGAMKKFLATFSIFEDKKSFTDAQVTEFINTLKAPSHRKYRSSLIVPFSANMAFILYRCQKQGKSEIKHKMLATVTEHPVKLGGCKDTDCNFGKFLETYQRMENCDLKQVCKPN